MTQELRRRRIFVIGAVAMIGGILAFLAYGNVGENLVYYWGPTELREAGDDAVGASIRLGGLVVPGSIERSPDSLDLRFQVTDGKATVPVFASTVPPAMFRGGTGVVIEGTARKDGVFESRRLMVKHDNEYRAPGDDAPRDMREMMKSLQLEATGG